MAKPLPVASAGPGSSEKVHCAPLPTHHRRRSSKPPLSTIAPSSALLSLLASIVSATTVLGSPAPPAFLCPSIPPEVVVDPVIREKRAGPTEILPDPKASSSEHRRHYVPVRYDKGPDGVWRKVRSYTLYGSTVSPSCTVVCPTSNVSSVDDQIQVGSQNNTTPPTSLHDVIADSLPPGWKPTLKPYEGRTTLILSLSLVLAFLICFFIVGCLFWRKRLKKRRKHKDVEAKARRIRNLNREQANRELAVEKEMKAKRKFWARATARWRANVRYSFRQRRAKRPSSRLSHTSQSTPSFDNSHSGLAGPSSSSLSTRPSPRSSTISLTNQLHDDVEVVTTTNTPLQDPVTPRATPPGSTPTSPPAYHHGIPPITSTTDDSTGDCVGPSGFDCSRQPSRSLTNSPLSLATDAENSEVFAPTPLHVGHVATDDKSLLARLVELASAPPPDNSADPTEIPDAPQVSAPAWHDESIEDFNCNQPNDFSIDESTCSLPPMFPPPPSKEGLAATELFSYPFPFDEAELTILDSEPSAPPFEERSSPALEGTLVPSAPPLSVDDDHFIPESEPSVPEWDPGASISHEDASGQDREQIPSDETTTFGSSPPSSNAQSPVTAPALPGYQP